MLALYCMSNDDDDDNGNVIVCHDMAMSIFLSYITSFLHAMKSMNTSRSAEHTTSV